MSASGPSGPLVFNVAGELRKQIDARIQRGGGGPDPPS